MGGVRFVSTGILIAAGHAIDYNHIEDHQYAEESFHDCKNMGKIGAIGLQ